jgi:hypothetical protein
MPKSGEQSSVVFALIVMEPASEYVCGGRREFASALPPPTSMFRNNLFKDDSALFSRFLRGQKCGLETPLPLPLTPPLIRFKYSQNLYLHGLQIIPNDRKSYSFFYFWGDFFSFCSYNIQHCFICRPSDSTVPTDSGIEPRTVATCALAVRRFNH